MAADKQFINNKIDTDQFSAFYQKVNYELEQLEKDFIYLEKQYFSLTPFYEKIFQRLDRMMHEAKENKASLLMYRIKHLSSEILKFHKSSGYNIDGFNNVFKSMRTIKTKLPDEIFSEDAINIIREKVKQEAARWIPEGLPRKSDLHKYLALENDGTHYLIEFRKKIWEKTVENKAKMRIQIKSISGDNIFLFKSLPGNTDKSQVKEKLAILIDTEKDEKLGILTDKLEGIMVFSEKFLKKNTDYFPVGDDHFAPYLTLKGMRYFIRK